MQQTATMRTLHERLSNTCCPHARRRFGGHLGGAGEAQKSMARGNRGDVHPDAARPLRRPQEYACHHRATDDTPKPSGKAPHNLTALLRDAGPKSSTFKPGSLDYTLSGTQNGDSLERSPPSIRWTARPAHNCALAQRPQPRRCRTTRFCVHRGTRPLTLIRKRILYRRPDGNTAWRKHSTMRSPRSVRPRTMHFLARRLHGCSHQ